MGLGCSVAYGLPAARLRSSTALVLILGRVTNLVGWLITLSCATLADLDATSKQASRKLLSVACLAAAVPQLIERPQLWRIFVEISFFYSLFGKYQLFHLLGLTGGE